MRLIGCSSTGRYKDVHGTSGTQYGNQEGLRRTLEPGNVLWGPTGIRKIGTYGHRLYDPRDVYSWPLWHVWGPLVIRSVSAPGQPNPGPFIGIWALVPVGILVVDLPAVRRGRGVQHRRRAYVHRLFLVVKFPTVL